MTVNFKKDKFNLREKLKELERPSVDKLVTKDENGTYIDTIRGNTKLESIDSIISDTAVDIFIYDTSKDSDGGAWRHRTTHTSWYNETLNTATRGSRREFPAVAVIVAEGYKLTIYDGDDPDLPMWMIFNRGTDTEPTMWWDGNNGNAASAITALNGILMLSTTNAGSYGADFIGERWIYFYNQQSFSGFRYNGGGLVNRNSAVSSRTVIEQFSGYALASQHRDVAMTVLPNAPIDNVTQLPRPTILIGQDDGLSIIKDDYNVVERQNTWNNDGGVWEVQFDEEHGGYWYSSAYYRESHGAYPNHGLVVGYEPDITATSTLSQANGNYQNRIHLSQGTSTTNLPGGFWSSSHIPDFWFISSNDNPNGGKVTFTNQGKYFGTQYGLTLFDGAYETIGSTTRSSLGCYINSEYNTGWMHGDIKGAFLSDTDATNVTYTTVADDWATAGAWTKQSNISISSTGSGTSGTLTITGSNNGSNVYFFNGISVEANTDYVVSITFGAYNANMFIINNTTYSSAGTVLDIGSQSGLIRGGHFNSGSNTFLYIQGWQYSSTATTITNITIQKVSERDRSVNNKGLQVFGTITKSAVATGAELVAYSGFSTSNYLEQPPNSDIYGFGSGDFSIIFWVNYSTNANYESIITVSDGTAGGWGVRLGPNTPVWQFWDTNTVRLNNVNGINGWQQVAFVRIGTSLFGYVNGNLINSNAAYSTDLSSLSAISSSSTLRIGSGGNSGSSLNLDDYGDNIALLRLSESAPSAEQIKKIYEDEKVLFQENAACTLYGSSDAVTALAYDEVTERLYVGTSSARSEFQGLCRINNTTTAVTTAISAYDSFVVEQ